jgi:hypothetical protein
MIRLSEGEGELTDHLGQGNCLGLPTGLGLFKLLLSPQGKER